MDLARGPTFALPSPPRTIPYVEKCRNGARRPQLARKQNHVCSRCRRGRPREERDHRCWPATGGRGGEEEEEEEGLWREEGGRSTLGVYARPEIQLRSIDRLRCSRQISVRCEIRRLVSLASWSRGLLASDTFDSSNRFVTRNRNFSKGDLPDSNGGETGCLPLIDNDRFGGRERGG